MMPLDEVAIRFQEADLLMSELQTRLDGAASAAVDAGQHAESARVTAQLTNELLVELRELQTGASKAYQRFADAAGAAATLVETLADDRRRVDPEGLSADLGARVEGLKEQLQSQLDGALAPLGEHLTALRQLVDRVDDRLSFFDADVFIGRLDDQVENLKGIAASFEASREESHRLLVWADAEKGLRGTQSRLNSLTKQAKYLLALQVVTIIFVLAMIFLK